MSKPDNVADNPGLMPYGTNVGAPAIKLENIDGWKQVNIVKANNQLQKKFNELKQEYQQLLNEYKWNELVYNSKYSFEPIIGETYHLYVGKNEELFLSLIKPNEWNYEHVGSFTLDSNNKWNKIQ